MSRSSKEGIALNLRISSDVLSIISKLRTRSISSIPELKVKDLLNDQDFDKFIFEVREDLLNRVFDGIQQSFINNNKVNIVVECAYESWKRIICLNSFFHCPCDEFCQKYSSWRPDIEPQISKPDTWCRGNISMKKRQFYIKEEKTDTVLSDYQLIKVEKYPKHNYFVEPMIKSELFKKKSSIEELFRIGAKQEAHYSVYNMPFQLNVTSPASSEKIDESIIVNRISETTTEDDTAFYKKIKRVEVNLPCLESNIIPRKKLGSFSRDEEIWKKKITFPPLRLDGTTPRGRNASLPMRTSKFSTSWSGNLPEFISSRATACKTKGLF